MRYILALSLAGLAVGVPNNSLWHKLTKRESTLVADIRAKNNAIAALLNDLEMGIASVLGVVSPSVTPTAAVSVIAPTAAVGQAPTKIPPPVPGVGPLNVTTTVGVAVAITTTTTLSSATSTTIPTISIKGVLSSTKSSSVHSKAHKTTAVRSSMMTTTVTSTPQLIITPPVFPPVTPQAAPSPSLLATSPKGHATVGPPVVGNGTALAPNANNGGQRAPLAPLAPFPKANGTATAATTKTSHAGGHGGGAGHATPAPAHGAANATSHAHKGTKKPKSTGAHKTAPAQALPTGNGTVPATPSPGHGGGSASGNAGNANVGKQDGNGTATVIVASSSDGNSTNPANATATGGAKLLRRGERERKLLKTLGRKKGDHVRMLRRQAAVMGVPIVERGLYDHLGGLRVPGARTGNAERVGGHHHGAHAV